MKKRLLFAGFFVALVAMIAASCANPTGGGNANPFVGTWVDNVSSNESYTYVYKSDLSFQYTWVQPSMPNIIYKGSYSYDTGAHSYKETVTQQSTDNGSTWTTGGWETDYSYTLSGNTLNFDDGSGYTPSFTKS